MTQDEFTQLQLSGKVETAKGPSFDDHWTAEQNAGTDADFTLEDFFPVLLPLLQGRGHLTSAPIFTPKTLLDAIQFFDNGTTRKIYVYINKAWYSVTVT